MEFDEEIKESMTRIGYFECRRMDMLLQYVKGVRRGRCGGEHDYG